MFAGYSFRLFTSSHNKNSSVLPFSHPTFTDTLTCYVTKAPEKPKEVQVHMSTATGTGSKYIISLISQSMEPRIKTVDFKLVQSVIFTELTPGDKFTVSVLSLSKGDKFLSRSQDLTFYTDSAEVELADYGCSSTETSVTFSYQIEGMCHQFLITLVFLPENNILSLTLFLSSFETFRPDTLRQNLPTFFIFLVGAFLMFLVGAFSLKEKSPTLTVSSFFFQLTISL